MRIAIVGAGVSGLVAAHLLHRSHAVTVFEAASHPGGHVHTVRVDTPDETHQVDRVSSSTTSGTIRTSHAC